MNLSNDSLPRGAFCPVETHPHWLSYPPASNQTHMFVGCLMTLLGITGVLGNTLVLFVFTRFRRLRGPFCAFIVNLAVADLSTAILHTMVAASSFKGAWLFGKFGCMFYACGVGYFGLLSIVTLSAIAIERYMVITAKPFSATWKITQYEARKVCVCVWIYCLFMSVPPLFGWSRYIPEGFLTSCSWDYLSRTTNNRSYYIYLLTLGFFIPVGVIVYCYAFILLAIVAHGREMASVKATGGGASRLFTRGGCGTARVTATRRPKINNTLRTAEIIMMLIILFLLSWTPYTVVTLIGQFGDVKLITPWVATLPALFAKCSVVYNPIVYGLSHPHFRSSIKQYLSTTCRTGNIQSATSTVPRTTNRVVQNTPTSTPTRLTTLSHFPSRRFHCLPHQCQSAEYYSEPDNQGITVILNQQQRDVTLHWRHGVLLQSQLQNGLINRSTSCTPRATGNRSCRGLSQMTINRSNYSSNTVNRSQADDISQAEDRPGNPMSPSEICVLYEGKGHVCCVSSSGCPRSRRTMLKRQTLMSPM